MFSRLDTIPVCEGERGRQTDRQTSFNGIDIAMQSVARVTRQYRPCYVCTTSLGRRRTTSDNYVCTTSLGRRTDVMIRRRTTTSDHYVCTTSARLHETNLVACRAPLQPSFLASYAFHSRPGAFLQSYWSSCCFVPCTKTMTTI